eukprot:gene10760-11959_t
MVLAFIVVLVVHAGLILSSSPWSSVYYRGGDGVVYGPYSIDELNGWVQEGYLPMHMLVSHTPDVVEAFPLSEILSLPFDAQAGLSPHFVAEEQILVPTPAHPQEHPVKRKKNVSFSLSKIKSMAKKASQWIPSKLNPVALHLDDSVQRHWGENNEVDEPLPASHILRGEFADTNIKSNSFTEHSVPSEVEEILNQDPHFQDQAEQELKQEFHADEERELRQEATELHWPEERFSVRSLSSQRDYFDLWNDVDPMDDPSGHPLSERIALLKRVPQLVVPGMLRAALNTINPRGIIKLLFLLPLLIASRLVDCALIMVGISLLPVPLSVLWTHANEDYKRENIYFDHLLYGMTRMLRCPLPIQRLECVWQGFQLGLQTFKHTIGVAIMSQRDVKFLLVLYIVHLIQNHVLRPIWHHHLGVILGENRRANLLFLVGQLLRIALLALAALMIMPGLWSLSSLQKDAVLGTAMLSYMPFVCVCFGALWQMWFPPASYPVSVGRSLLISSPILLLTILSSSSLFYLQAFTNHLDLSSEYSSLAVIDRLWKWREDQGFLRGFYDLLPANFVNGAMLWLFVLVLPISLLETLLNNAQVTGRAMSEWANA